MRFLRNAMRKSKKEKPPTLYLPVTYDLYNKESALSCSSVFEDSDIEDEDCDTTTDSMGPPVLGLTIPGATGPYCPRRPTLQEVLSNTAPPPWTLAAFMAYLSQNHCLETLEFTMDASRYSKHYNTMLEHGEGMDLDEESSDVEYVRMLWQKLTDAYLTPNGPREVNLPSNVRDKIISLDNTKMPPHSDNLDEAVKIVYELMNESVLNPFLNSVAPLRGSGTVVSPWTSADNMPDLTYSGSADTRSTSPSRKTGNIPLASSAPEAFKTASPRQPRSSNLSAALRSSAGYRLSQYITGSTTSTADSNEATPIEDGRPSSVPESEPMTPPTTPPTSDITFSPGTSPRSTREGGWKNLGMKLGWKKSRSTHGSTSSMSSGGGSQSKIPMVKDSVPEEEQVL